MCMDFYYGFYRTQISTPDVIFFGLKMLRNKRSVSLNSGRGLGADANTERGGEELGNA